MKHSFADRKQSEKFDWDSCFKDQIGLWQASDIFNHLITWYIRLQRIT
jgi:hypothetical protein